MPRYVTSEMQSALEIAAAMPNPYFIPMLHALVIIAAASAAIAFAYILWRK